MAGTRVLRVSALGVASLIPGPNPVGAYDERGANAFLMAYIARFEVCGLNVEIYNQCMRAERIDELGRPLVAR